MHRPFSAVLFAGLLVLSCPAFAQSPDAASNEVVPPLGGRHSITLGLGLLPQLQVDPGRVRTSGFLGSLSYTYWPYAAWGLELSASAHSMEATVGETAAVTSFVVGANYYPEALAFGPATRVYLMGAVGPYIGFATSGFTASVRTEAVVGTRLGMGLDARIGKWVRVGARGAYHAAPEYEQALGAISSASGVQLSLEIGVIFGGR